MRCINSLQTIDVESGLGSNLRVEMQARKTEAEMQPRVINDIEEVLQETPLRKTKK